MAPSPQTPGIVGGRLSPEALAANFADIAPPLTAHEALVAADRCYFCYDAPCVTACPTSIDIPLFIREIASGVPEAAARTILAPEHPRRHVRPRLPHRDPLRGGLRARGRRGQPVEIGRLQRYATDTLMREGPQPFPRAEPTGRRVAVVGAGPAGLACAHRLAMLGHDVDPASTAATSRAASTSSASPPTRPSDGFAQAEVAWLLGIGGITLRHGRRASAAT